jgi:hypothetical protein
MNLRNATIAAKASAYVSVVVSAIVSVTRAPRGA